MGELPINSVASRQWLASLIREKCQVNIPYDYQITHGLDLINGKDLFLVIAPGMGKTTVLLAPLIAAHAKLETGIALMVVPTKLLGEQMACVASKCGLRALAINEDTVHGAYYEDRDLFAELENGRDIRIGIMSPQMLQSERMRELLGKSTFKTKTRWLLIDEVHLSDEQSGVWRVPYSNLKILRARLSSKTIWAGVTGTATPTRALRIAASLGFQPGYYVNARHSVDRANLKFIPRFYRYPVSGDEFLDLAFIIPFRMTTVDDLEQTFIFANTIEETRRVMHFLDKLIPRHIPGRDRLIRLYNSMMPKDYRAKCMHDMVEGVTLRVLLCTDTCTYGLDLPNVCRGVNLGLTDSIEILIQRGNRLSRDGGPAEFYTFVPPWVREMSPAIIKTAQHKEDTARRAKLDLVTLQWYNSTSRLCPRQAYLAYNDESTAPPKECCTTHTPEPQNTAYMAATAQWKTYLDAKKTAKSGGSSLHTDKTYRALDSKMRAALFRMLEHWRLSLWLSICGDDYDTPVQVFIPTEIIQRLSDKAHLCSSLDRLRIVISETEAGPWAYFDEYGQELLTYLDRALQGFGQIFEECRRAAMEAIIIEDDPAEEDSNISVAMVKLEVNDVHALSLEPTSVDTRHLKRQQPGSPLKIVILGNKRRCIEGKENRSQ